MANSPHPLGVGTVIADTYTLDALIGRGGMGEVYVASHKRLPGKRVAIKFLHAEVASDEVLARFRREAEIASQLGHPNIVQVHDFNVTPDGTPYLVLEFLDGVSLAERIASGPLALDAALSIARQVGSALATAHRAGVVHRDLKPQNILLVRSQLDGHEIELAKVLDFGISKIQGSHTIKTLDSMLLGTPQYMSPEQAKGDHSNVDERTDVFALAAIVYEMLTGRAAFSGATIHEVVFKVVYEPFAPLAPLAPTAPANVVAAVERGLAKQPAERFPTIAAFVGELTGSPLSTTPGATLRPLPPATIASRPSKMSSHAPAAFDATIDSSHRRQFAQAETMVSDPQLVPPPPPPSTPPVSQPQVSRAPRRWWIPLAGLSVIAVAVIAVYLVGRDSAKHQGDRIAGGGHDAAAIAAHDAATPIPQAADAAEATDAAIAPDAAIKPPAPLHRPPPPPPPSDPANDPMAQDESPLGARLVEAERALGTNPKLAERIASDALIERLLTPRQRLRVHAIRGRARCALGDEDGARTDFNQVAGVPFLARLIRQACGWKR